MTVNGTIQAEYAVFAYSGGSGISVASGGTILSTKNFSRCRFRNGAGTAYLTVANNQNLTIDSLTIDSAATGRCTYNLQSPGGSGTLTLNRTYGTLARENFENENSGGVVAPGRIIWMYTIPPDNDMTLVVSVLTDSSVALAWNPAVIDSGDADSTGIWYKTGDYPDSAYDPAATLLRTYPKSVSRDTLRTLSKTTVYWFSLTVRDTFGNWADPQAAACDTAKTFGDDTVTVGATDVLTTGFVRGDTVRFVRLTFSGVTRGARVNQITVNRTGNATDAEVPRALVYLDANQDDIIDNPQAPLAQGVFVSGQAQIIGLGNTVPGTTANWLLAYPVAPNADELHAAGGIILSTGIAGTQWTTVSFDGITSGDHTLPVRLSSVRAQYAAGAVSLLWRTETETDNLKWRVLRKAEGVDQYLLLTEIVKHEGEQTTAFPTDYRYEDRTTTAGAVYYYLLEDVALDGTITRHGPVRVSTLAEPREAAGWQVVSQPVRAGLRITSVELATHVELTVYSLAGIPRRHVAADNTNFISLDVRALPTGIYTFALRVRRPDGSETQSRGRLLKVE
jgi:hypothetical protein